MTTIGIPEPAKLAQGFNPCGLTPHEVGEKYGWRLLNEGEPLQEGDGFWHPDVAQWLVLPCRPELLREGGFIAHTFPHRRKDAQ